VHGEASAIRITIHVRLKVATDTCFSATPSELHVRIAARSPAAIEVSFGIVALATAAIGVLQHHGQSVAHEVHGPMQPCLLRYVHEPRQTRE